MAPQTSAACLLLSVLCTSPSPVNDDVRNTLPPPPIELRGSPYTKRDSIRVQVDLPALKFFADEAGNREKLQRYLEASPDWRVGNERGELIARRREDRRTTLNGNLGQPPESVRIGFIFQDQPSVPHYHKVCTTTVPPDAGAVDVNVCSYSMLPAQRQSVLHVGVPGTWLAVEETDSRGEINKLPSLLELADAELAQLRKALEEGKSPQDALPKDAIHAGEPTLEIDDSAKQTLRLTAWINPGEAGVTWIRVYSTDDAKRLKIIDADLYATERGGYSDKKDQLFYYDSEIMVRDLATGWDTKHEINIQLWFKPDSGGESRMLLEKNANVSGWER